MKSIDLNGKQLPVFVAETLYRAKQYVDIRAKEDGYANTRWTTKEPYKLTRYHLGVEDDITLYSIEPIMSDIQF
jgi:hypothetical protein